MDGGGGIEESGSFAALRMTPCGGGVGGGGDMNESRSFASLRAGCFEKARSVGTRSRYQSGADEKRVLRCAQDDKPLRV